MCVCVGVYFVWRSPNLNWAVSLYMCSGVTVGVSENLVVLARVDC